MGGCRKLVARHHAHFESTDPPVPSTSHHVSVKLLAKKKLSRELCIQDLAIQECTDWKGRVIQKELNGHRCVKSRVTCQAEVDVERREVVLDTQLQSINSVEEYLAYNRLCKTDTQLLSSREAKRYSKRLQVTTWLTEDFPLSLQDFLPLLDLLGTTSKKAGYVRSFFDRFTAHHKFPIKADIPLYLALKLQIEVKSIQLESVILDHVKV